MILVEVHYDRIVSLRKRNARSSAAYIAFLQHIPNPNVVGYGSPSFEAYREEEEYFRLKPRLPNVFNFISPVFVPALIGLDVQAALTLLANVGLVGTVVLQDLSLTIPYNTVFTQSIAAGTPESTGTNVTLVVQDLTIVPSVVGLTQAAAIAAISAAFLTSSVVQVIAAFPPGTVIFQGIPAGLGEHANTLVVLTVAMQGNGFRVCAVTAGWYGGEFRKPGDVFDLLQASDFSDYTLNYEIAGNESTFGWMMQVAQSTPLTQDDGSGFLTTVDPLRRFVE